MSGRRLPVYLLLDTSGSMHGDPIAAVNNGLQTLRVSLFQDPQAIDTVHLSIITFDRTAKVVLPLTPLDQVQLPELETPDAGPTHLGEALKLLRQEVAANTRKTSADMKGDWAPFLFVMTDGAASDKQLFRQEAQLVKTAGFQSIIGCLAGHSTTEADLKEFCDPILHLGTMDTQSFMTLFKWVSAAITSKNNSQGANGEVSLPPVPEEVVELPPVPQEIQL